MSLHRNYFGQELTPWESHNQNNILFSATSYPIHRFQSGPLSSHRMRKRSLQARSIPPNIFNKSSDSKIHSKTKTMIKFENLQIGKQKNLHNLTVKLSPLKNIKKNNKNYTLNFFKRCSKVQKNVENIQTKQFLNKTNSNTKLKHSQMAQSWTTNRKVRAHSLFI